MSRPIEGNTHAILNSPSYRLAEEDTDFLKQDALRPVRLQLELLKPEMVLAEHGVRSTIVAFGGTQIVEKHEAEERLAPPQQALADTLRAEATTPFGGPILIRHVDDFSFILSPHFSDRMLSGPLV